MSYLEQLKQKNSETYTLNGAKTWSTTGNACLDLFAVAGGMRYRGASDLIRLFERAYIEEPESAKKNVRLISEFGRFDDLFCLLGTPAEDEVICVVKDQLKIDLAALEKRKSGNINAHISLLAKWMPSVNASSPKTRSTARRLARALKMTDEVYRKTLSALRSNICLTERYITEKRLEKVQYSAVPAGAMLKYHRAFMNRDTDRFTNYIHKASEGSEPIHCDTLFPYEILRPYVRFRGYKYWPYMLTSPECSDVLEALWKNLPSNLTAENAICIVDVSGSMFIAEEDQIPPALISLSLGLYHAERCRGAFHNHFISFDTEPQLLEIHGKTLEDKRRYIESTPWSGSTNLEAVFDLLLNTAIKSNASQEEMPSTLYIISDMEFNCAVVNPDETVFDNVKERFEANGHHLPVVVFINVNSWQMQTPVRAHEKGTALLSGASVHSFKERCDGNTTPLSHMYKTLLSDRYKEVHA